MVDRGVITGISSDTGQGQLRQGRGQGRAEGDVQDGHLDAGVLHRRAAVPGHRHQPAGARRVLHRADAARSAASTSTTSPTTSPPGTRWPTWTGPTSGRTASSRSAASTSGAARASTTCSTRTRCSSCSTPPAPASTRSSRSTPQLVDDQSERMASLRGLLKFKDGDAPAGAARRGRAGQRDRQAVLHRRDELRLDLRRGPRDAGDRDEPPWRPVELGRGRRGRQPLRPRRERRLAPQRDQAGGVRPVRRDQPLPDQLHRHPDQDGPGRETR